MNYDTAGKPIHEPIQNCNCKLTGGCEKCNPRWNKLIFDSQGHIEPWGRDFWTEKIFAEFLVIGGGALIGFFLILILALLIVI